MPYLLRKTPRSSFMTMGDDTVWYTPPALPPTAGQMPMTPATTPPTPEPSKPPTPSKTSTYLMLGGAALLAWLLFKR